LTTKCYYSAARHSWTPRESSSLARFANIIDADPQKEAWRQALLNMRFTRLPCSFSSKLIGLKRGQILHHRDEFSEIHRLDDVQMKTGA
jgi:hypothetical protein